MLQELHIRNFAIIDELHLRFEPGFNILTGETGAGKSILIDAVDLLLGSRADLSALRAGESRGIVEGLFVLGEAEQVARAELLAQEGLQGERTDTLWVSRELRDDGRSVARINGTMVSVSLLREVAEGLIDIHGQSEHLSLLRVRRHLDLLDRFADLYPLRQDVRERVRQLQQVRRELRSLQEGERERMQRLDLLRFQVEEINSVAPRVGELEKLEEERTRLANAQQLSSLVAKLLMILEEGESETETPSILDLIGEGQREMNALVRIDASLNAEAEGLEDVVYKLEDLARSLRDYLDSVEYNPRRLRQVEDRRVHLRQLCRKYGATLEDVLSHAESAAAEIATLEYSDERIAELETEADRLMAGVAVRCEELSQRRQTAAQQLAARVEGELADLRMENAHFGVTFHWEPAPRGVPLSAPLPAERRIVADGGQVADQTEVNRVTFDATGMDRVEFLIEPNVGEGLKPMAKIASGGETSRLMLALKTVLSRIDNTPTLIFDEIDQGIGGRVGAVVGEKLWRLAHSESDSVARQVLCITHLPQLAGFGDVHFGVRKAVTGGRTTTQIERLADETRLRELAQMLGTAEDDELRGSREILAQAERLKRQSAEEPHVGG